MAAATFAGTEVVGVVVGETGGGACIATCALLPVKRNWTNIPKLSKKIGNLAQRELRNAIVLVYSAEVTSANRGISLVVKHQFSKLRLGVRFSHPAQKNEVITVRDERHTGCVVWRIESRSGPHASTHGSEAGSCGRCRDDGSGTPDRFLIDC